MSKAKKVNMDFPKWLGLECKHGDLLLPVIEMVLLTVIALLLFWQLCLVLIAVFGLTLRWRWKKALAHPAWYLKEDKNDGGS